MRVIVFSIMLFISTTMFSKLGILLDKSTGFDRFLFIAVDPIAVKPWMLAGLAILVFSVLYLYKTHHTPKRRDVRIGMIITAVFLYMSGLMLLYQIKLFNQQQVFNWWLLQYGMVVLMVLYLMIIVSNGSKSLIILCSGAAAYVLIMILSLEIPMNSFSDMLFLIQSAGKNFIAGHNPYGRQYFINYAVSPTYLPGMWLSYLPAVLFKFDLRLMSMVFMTLFCIYSYRLFEGNSKIYGAILIALFMSNPWLNYRNDLYIGAYLWLLAAFAYSLKKNKSMQSAVFMGIASCVYQFNWVIWPMWTAREINQRGFKKALKPMFVSAVIPVFVIVPFIIWGPQEFFNAILFHWTGKDTGHYNLISWMPEAVVLFIQITAFIFGPIWILKTGNDKGNFFLIAAIILGIFLISNVHSSSHYFFFIFAALMLYYEAMKSDTKILRKLPNKPR